MEFGIGIIGATGYVGSPYRAEIRDAQDPEIRIVGLCARRQDRLDAAKLEDQAELVTQDWREVVDHPDVNLVFVLTPDALHHEPVLATAAAGKHLFCEKPIGMNVAQASEMWSAFRDTGLAHYVPFWTRYVPAFCRARELVREGRLGEIKTVVYRWHNPRSVAMPFTWRDDAALSAAGSLADVGSHAYDTLRWILGEDALRVMARTDVVMPAKPDLGAIDLAEALTWGETHQKADAEQVRKGTAPDHVQLAVEFPSGTIGCLLLSHAAFVRKGFAPELELHGTEASVSVDRLTGALLFADSPEPAREMQRLPLPGDTNRFANFVFPALRAQLSGETTPHAHPQLEDGWRNQIFTDAAAAADERRTWVEVGEFE